MLLASLKGGKFATQTFGSSFVVLELLSLPTTLDRSGSFKIVSGHSGGGAGDEGRLRPQLEHGCETLRLFL